jgi:acyl-CoA dehydrogenase
VRPDELDLPFFDDLHRELGARARAFSEAHLGGAHGAHSSVDDACRALVRSLGAAGFLRYAVPGAHGGALPQVDSRALCLLRSTFAYYEGLADFAFAMQGLGSGAMVLAGAESLCARYMPRVASGEAIAAFALSEPEAGSDVAAMGTTAKRAGDRWVLDGEKTWISNGGIADFYTIFARTDEGRGARGISAFVLPAETPGLVVAERIEVTAPHPLARLTLRECAVPADHLLGEQGRGFELAMRTLDIFRASVAAAALGFGRRALDESVKRSRARKMFGATLGDLQLTQARLADMATELDSASLLTIRAAWTRDVKGARTTREAAMAKLAATEAAQRAADGAVQLFGGAGVVRESWPERLYREVRALRIYEGASEVQKVVIARDLLREPAPSKKEAP